MTLTDNIIADIQEEFSQVDKEQTEGSFPAHAMPATIQAILKEFNEKSNYPIDYFATSILLASSIAIGSTHKVSIKRGWEESALLFVALIGAPGVNKSHPLSEALKVHRKKDALYYAEYLEAYKMYERRIKEIKVKEKDNAEVIEPPKRKQSLLGDTTGEAMIGVLRDNPRGCGLVNDELSGTFKNLNRYNPGSEEETLLTIFSGKPISTNRKTNGSIYIEHPYLAIGGTIQQEVYKEIFGRDNRSNSGLSDRFLHAFPKTISRPHFNENEVDYNIFLDYSNAMNRLLLLDFKQDETGTASPHVLKFDNEAKAAFIEWSNYNTDLINETTSERNKGIYSKLEIYVLRLSLIVQLLSWACEEADREAIEVKAVRSAIELAEYYRQTAVRAAALTTRSPHNVLTELQTKVIEALPQQFTTAEGLEIIKNVTVGNKTMPVRTFADFLNKRELFKKLDHGEYQKL